VTQHAVWQMAYTQAMAQCCHQFCGTSCPGLHAALTAEGLSMVHCF